MGITFYNCRGGTQINIEKGKIVEEEQSERVNCKGMEVKPLNCTVALKPSKSLEDLLLDPVPSEEFLDSLVLGGVGLAIVPSGKSSLIEVKEAPFVLDPMAPPEEVPQGEAVVQRAVTPESSFGYKEKYGEWPVKHLNGRLEGKIILNPFWVTTWEVRLVKLPSFVPHVGPIWGISSPIPPELLEAIYSPFFPGEGPKDAALFAEMLSKSHYWNSNVKAFHLDDACWRFAGKSPPKLKPGEEARFFIMSKWVRYYVNGENVLFPDDLDELAVETSKITLFP